MQTAKPSASLDEESARRAELSIDHPAQADIQTLKERLHKAEKWMIWLTAAIAFTGLCAVIVAVFQSQAMQGQLDEMRNGSRDTRTLAEAAKKQADKAEMISDHIQQAANAMDMSNRQAQQAFRATERAAELNERAWVSVSVKSNANFAVGRFNVNVNVSNKGKTPAVNTRSVVRSKTVTKADSPTLDLEWPIFRERDYVSEGTLASDGPPLYRQFLYDITAADIENIKTLNARTYIYGRIEFRDVFGKSHWLTFCTFLSPEGGFDYCTKHNDIDKYRP